MFALILICLPISILICVCLCLIYEIRDLKTDNFIMSCEINKYIRENSKLRKELKNVL